MWKFVFGRIKTTSRTATKTTTLIFPLSYVVKSIKNMKKNTLRYIYNRTECA